MGGAHDVFGREMILWRGWDSSTLLYNTHTLVTTWMGEWISGIVSELAPQIIVALLGVIGGYMLKWLLHTRQTEEIKQRLDDMKRERENSLGI